MKILRNKNLRFNIVLIDSCMNKKYINTKNLYLAINFIIIISFFNNISNIFKANLFLYILFRYY